MHSLDRAALGTPWRFRHPAEKVMLAAGLAGLAMLAPSPAGPLLAAGTATLLACLAADIPWTRWSRACAAPGAMVAVTAAGGMLQLNTAGIHLLPPDALASVLERALRAGGAIAALVLLAATTPPTDLLAPLRRLPAMHDLTLAIYRLIVAGEQTRQHLHRAHAARGSAGARRWAAAGALLGTLARRTLQRARAQDRALAQRAGAAHWALLAVYEPCRRRVCAAQLLGLAGLSWLAWSLG